jgi:hypothetical protein
MFEIIEGGFNLYINEVIDFDISWLASTISLIVMNVLLSVRRFGVWCKQLQKAADYKIAEKKLAKANK